jgi:hypothetical protein
MLEDSALTGQMLAARTYVPDVRPEGTTASSKGFSQKEQAEEGQFIRKRELEKLKEAQDKVKAAQAEVVSVVVFGYSSSWISRYVGSPRAPCVTHRPLAGRLREKGGRATWRGCHTAGDGQRPRKITAP